MKFTAFKILVDYVLNYFGNVSLSSSDSTIWCDNSLLAFGGEGLKQYLILNFIMFMNVKHTFSKPINFVTWARTP